MLRRQLSNGQTLQNEKQLRIFAVLILSKIWNQPKVQDNRDEPEKIMQQRLESASYFKIVPLFSVWSSKTRS